MRVMLKPRVFLRMLDSVRYPLVFMKGGATGLDLTDVLSAYFALRRVDSLIVP